MCIHDQIYKKKSVVLLLSQFSVSVIEPSEGGGSAGTWICFGRNNSKYGLSEHTKNSVLQYSSSSL